MYACFFITLEKLSDMLEEEAKKNGIQLKLLTQLLNIERIHLYISEESRQSVLNKLRNTIQEESSKNAS